MIYDEVHTSLFRLNASSGFNCLCLSLPEGGESRKRRLIYDINKLNFSAIHIKYVLLSFYSADDYRFKLSQRVFNSPFLFVEYWVFRASCALYSSSKCKVICLT